MSHRKGGGSRPPRRFGGGWAVLVGILLIASALLYAYVA